MSTQQELSVNDAIAHVIGDMANAISERQGEGRQEQAVRARVATAMIEDFRPKDVAQVMLAGYCVMFHAVVTDSIRDTLRGELDTTRHATRSNIVAMNKSFHMNLDRLDRYRKRATAGEPVAAAVPQPDETIQPRASEPPEVESPAAVTTPAPATAQPRVPVGAAQPRQQSNQPVQNPANGNGAVPAAPGETTTPPSSASVSSPT